MVKCEGRRRTTTTRLMVLFLIFLDFIVHATLLVRAANSEGTDQSNMMMRLELIHRHSPKLEEMGNLYDGRKKPKSQLEIIRELLHNDLIRQKGISQRFMQRPSMNTTRRKTWEKITNISTNVSNSNNNGSRYNECADYVSVKMPMNSGADFGTGQYFVMFRAGTPPQKSLLIADTGSDLTWMKCRLRQHRCRKCNKPARHRRFFRADRSSSFTTFPCSSRMCKIELMNLFSLARCPSFLTPCAYDYRYTDGSIAKGIFANETVTFDLTNGDKMKLDDVLIGCSGFSRIQSFRGADGVMGLGYSKYSFAVKATEKFGGKFSYCLVDHLSPRNISNYLIFGAHKKAAAKPKDMQYTELALGVINPFYAVNIKGISIGGKILEIPVEVWDVNGIGGTILDSGSSLTFLTSPAYSPVMAALKGSLMKFRKVNLDTVPMEHCFNSTDFQHDLVPRLAFHFADGARLEPPVKSYIIDVAPGVKCVGIVSTSWPGTSVIGNIMQQNHLWEFDLRGSKLGFAPSSCT